MIPIPPNHCDKDLQKIRKVCSLELGKTEKTDAPVVVIPETDSKIELTIMLSLKTGLIKNPANS